MFEGWTNLSAESFDSFVKDTLGWTMEGDVVKIPLNKDNEARPTVTRENVKFDRKYYFLLPFPCSLLFIA